MGMFHSTSGKSGYLFYDGTSLMVISREELINILKIEDNIRSSHEIQSLYSKEFSDGNQYLEHIKQVTEQLQVVALRNSGIKEQDIGEYLKSFRSHRIHYKNDPEILKV